MMIRKLNDLVQSLGFDLILLGKVVAILLAAFILERFLYLVLRRAYKRNITPGREEVTRYRFLRNATRFVVGTAAIVAIIYSIPSIKHLAVTLFAGAGILVAILGLATQRAFSNIISGVFIVSFKPFRVGDIIQLGDGSRAGYSGVVEDITLRHTVIVNAENKRVIVPNAVISDEVIVNSTLRDETICVPLEVNVAHGTDLDRAMRILAEEAVAHPSCLDRRTAGELDAGEAVVPVRVVRIAENGPVLRASVWAADPPRASAMHHDLLGSVARRFWSEGIEIPYPHRVVLQPDAAPARQRQGNEEGPPA